MKQADLPNDRVLPLAAPHTAFHLEACAPVFGARACPVSSDRQPCRERRPAPRDGAFSVTAVRALWAVPQSVERPSWTNTLAG
jgi:hypothetical protein